MKSILAAGALSLIAVIPALAALPPQYQRQRELAAIIESAAIIDAFGIANPIDSIAFKGQDLYVVSGGACSMEVRIIDVPQPEQAPGFVGPRNFAVEPGDLVCN